MTAFLAKACIGVVLGLYWNCIGIARQVRAMYGQDMLAAEKNKIQDFVLVLGVESSCDETAASVVRRTKDGQVEVLSSLVASQDEIHTPYGGVVPELAARAHMQKIESMMGGAVESAGVKWTDLHAVAATSGPGLIGGVITGLMAAKGLAVSLDIPLIGVNHLEGHALSPRLTVDCPFPYLLLLVSGGHTQLLSVKGIGDFSRIGSTVDDAAGETFDKTAKVMGLGFPGGPALERMARTGDPKAVKLPRPFFGKPHADFSFSGLKTATLRAHENLGNAVMQAVRIKQTWLPASSKRFAMFYVTALTTRWMFLAVPIAAPIGLWLRAGWPPMPVSAMPWRIYVWTKILP